MFSQRPATSLGNESLGSANGFYLLHSFFHGWFREVSAFLKFFKNSGAFILLLEPF